MGVPYGDVVRIECQGGDSHGGRWGTSHGILIFATEGKVLLVSQTVAMVIDSDMTT